MRSLTSALNILWQFPLIVWYTFLGLIRGQPTPLGSTDIPSDGEVVDEDVILETDIRAKEATVYCLERSPRLRGYSRKRIRRVVGMAVDSLPPYASQGDKLMPNYWRRRVRREVAGRVRAEYSSILIVILLQVILPIVIKLVIEWWLNRRNPEEMYP